MTKWIPALLSRTAVLADCACANRRCGWPRQPISNRCCRRFSNSFDRLLAYRVEATYQASAMLTTQIQNGAPFDLFLSADWAFPSA